MTPRLIARTLAAGALLAANSLCAQTVRGIVTLPDSSRAAGVIVIATDTGGATAARALTGEAGTYELRLPAAGHYGVRVVRIGFRPTIVPAFDIAAGETKSLPITLRGDPIVLAAVTVQGKNVCRVQQDAGQAVAQLWEEARKAITATQLSPAGKRQTVEWMQYDRTTDLSGEHVLSEVRNTSSASAMAAFVSLPPDSLAKVGYMTDDESGTVYRAPDAAALLSAPFAAMHCFRAEPPPKNHGDWVWIAFRPAKDGEIVDIEGTLWLDRASSELRELDFRYTNLPADFAHTKAGGTVQFLRLSTGSWLVGNWQLRMPRGTRELVSTYSGSLRGRDEYRTVVTGLQFTGGAVTAVTRGREVLFSSGESTHDYSPDLLAADAKLALSCPDDTSGGELHALLRGTVFEGEHKGIPGASVRLTWRTNFTATGGNNYSFRNEQRDLTSDAAGNWYVCGVPRDRVVTARATVGRRTSAPVTVRIPKERTSAGVDLEVPPT
ncbi:MAG: carboxypeptidase-like regulatory domain-containing protein [Gemmatimonadaceae bacterium]